MTDRIIGLVEATIQELETYDKQGESYSDDQGRHGWRNPIRADTGPILRALALTESPSRALEIGTAHGLSALYLAAGMIHREGCRLDSIELDSTVAAAAQARMDHCHVPVKVHAGEALDVLSGLSERYALIFLDAQKSHYLRQLQAMLDAGLVGKGTLILADNVTDRRSECQDFLDWFQENGVPHWIMPTECGLLVSRL